MGGRRGRLRPRRADDRRQRLAAARECRTASRRPGTSPSGDLLRSASTRQDRLGGFPSLRLDLQTGRSLLLAASSPRRGSPSRQTRIRLSGTATSERSSASKSRPPGTRARHHSVEIRRRPTTCSANPPRMSDAKTPLQAILSNQASNPFSAEVPRVSWLRCGIRCLHRLVPCDRCRYGPRPAEDLTARAHFSPPLPGSGRWQLGLSFTGRSA